MQNDTAQSKRDGTGMATEGEAGIEDKVKLQQLLRSKLPLRQAQIAGPSSL